jgi:hypothetical protein
LLEFILPIGTVGILEDERQANMAEPSKPEIDICITQITPDSKFYDRIEGVEIGSRGENGTAAYGNDSGIARNSAAGKPGTPERSDHYHGPDC